jgi:hypothetical protein
MHSIPRNQIVTDIQSGMGDRDLMTKYELSPGAFQRVLQRLIVERVIDHEDLYENSEIYRQMSDLLAARRHPRVPIPMAIRVIRNGGSQTGFIRDVSAAGLRVAGIEAKVGETTMLSIPLKEIPVIAPIILEAKCRRSEWRGKQRKFVVTGFEVTNMSEEARRSFDQLIDFFQPPNRENAPASFHSPRTTDDKSPTNSCDFSGTIHGVDILDIVHFLLLNRQKVLLDVRDSYGDQCNVYIADGEIIHAVWRDLDGVEAFMAGMTFDGGSFVTSQWEEPEERTIFSSGELLLIEAARRRDETTGRCELKN